MAKAAIFTLEPKQGGVPALARIIYDILAEIGHSPHLVYCASESFPATTYLHKIRYLLTTPPVRRFYRDGIWHTSIVDYPVPMQYRYRLLEIARPECAMPITIVASGSSHVGLPLALQNRRFIAWVATVYEDELQSRALAGDVWAMNMLSRSAYHALETQEALVIQKATAVLALSSHTARNIVQKWPEAANRLHTIYYPVDTDRFTPGTTAEKAPFILLVARIRDPRKNVNLLLRAFAKAQINTMTLIIVGDEPLPGTIQLAHELGIANQTSFLGTLSEDEVLKLYRTATLFALPSLQEGLGISVLEAMACGLPVISTKCGGPENLVIHERTGLLVANNDEDEFAEALELLVLDRVRLQTYGAAGRERAEKVFSKAIIKREIIAIVNQVFGPAIVA